VLGLSIFEQKMAGVGHGASDVDGKAGGFGRREALITNFREFAPIVGPPPRIREKKTAKKPRNRPRREFGTPHAEHLTSARITPAEPRFQETMS
jgi:hypothetical protein